MSSDAKRILNLESLIKGYLGDLNQLREKLRAQKEMVKSTYEGDRDYSEATAETQKLKKKEKEIKERLVKNDGVVAINMKIEQLQTEVKNIQFSLSDYLNAALTNSTEFIGPDGELFQIVRSAKLAKKKV